MHLNLRRLVTMLVVMLFVLLIIGTLAISSAEGSVGDLPTNTRPDLSISVTGPYWDSYTDYTNGDLSVGFAVNNGGPDAFEVAITGSINTGGVTLSSATPVAVGDIASGGSEPVTLVYHVPTGVLAFSANITATANDADGNSYGYPVDPASTLIYSSNVQPAAISVIDVENQQLVNNFFLDYLAPTDQQGHFLSVSPDGQYLWVSEQISTTDGYVAVLDAITGEELKRWDVGAGVGNHMSHDGKWLFVASAKINGVNVFDVENQTYLGSFSLGAANHVMDESPDGNTLWVTDMGLGNLCAFDISGLPGTLPTPSGIVHIGGLTHALLAHPNGKYVFVGSSGAPDTLGTVVVDVDTMSVVKTQAGGMPGGPSLHPHNYAISPDENYLVIGDIGTYT